MEITTRKLLDLQAGARLRVKLLSGREIDGTLVGRPRLEQRGKPGIHRVRLRVADESTMVRIGTDLVIGYDTKGHNVGGNKVLEIKDPWPHRRWQ